MAIIIIISQEKSSQPAPDRNEMLFAVPFIVWFL